ncbi:hypothetical protein BDF22DRAFT_687224 [Syncephalis plumigaleata]|nr:hypothetical protein BDF22DRAFT_687224 [Syncephalis plumigaleata]
MIRNLFFTAIVLSVYSLQLCSVYSMETGNPQSSAMLPQQQQQQGIDLGHPVSSIQPMVVHAETNEQGDISVDISGKCTYKAYKTFIKQLTFWRKCGSIDVHIKCHTNKVLYNSEDTIYNDGQVGCFLFKLPSSHTHSRSYFRKGLTLREAGHFQTTLLSVAYLNSIIIFLSKENASPLVKLIDFEFALFDPTNIDTHASAYSALLAKQKALVLFTMQSQMKDISSMIRKYTQNDSLVRLRITLGIPNFDYPTLYHIFEKNPDYKIISKVLTLD